MTSRAETKAARKPTVSGATSAALSSFKLFSRLNRLAAVIVGSAMYMFHWQRDALSLIKRHEAELRQRPTWLFSSGPTGGSPQADATLDEVRRSPTDYPPLGTVAELAERIGARGHATFPGRIEEGVGGIFSRWVPKGDWRDFDAIRDWADAIAADLEVGALVAR